MSNSQNTILLSQLPLISQYSFFSLGEIGNSIFHLPCEEEAPWCFMDRHFVTDNTGVTWKSSLVYGIRPFEVSPHLTHGGSLFCLTFELKQAYERFQCVFGLPKFCRYTSLKGQLTIWGTNNSQEPLFRSGVITGGVAPEEIDVCLSGEQSFTILFESDWCNVLQYECFLLFDPILVRMIE